MKINDVNDSTGYATLKEREDQVERNKLETSPLLWCVNIRGEKIKGARNSRHAKFNRNKVNSFRKAGPANTIFKVGGPKHNLFIYVIIFVWKR